MSDEAPLASSPSPRPAKRTRFVWILFSLALLTGAGAVALTQCPWFHANVPAVEKPRLEKNVEVLEGRVRMLESNMKTDSEHNAAVPQDNSANLAALSDSVKTLQAQITQIQNDRAQDKQSAQKTISVAFAFWEVRSAVNEGHSFSAPLAVLQKAAENNISLAQPLAILFTYASGVATFTQLHADLTTHEPDTAAPTDTDTPTWQERAKKVLRSLVSVRSLHNAVYDPLEQALANGDAQGATIAFAALPDEARKSLLPWQEKFKARIAVDAALRDAAAALALPTPDNSAAEQGAVP